MDEELRVYLAAFETRLSERIGALGGRIDPLGDRIGALGQRIGQVESRLEGRIDRLSERVNQVEAKLSERIDQVEAKLSERIENVETSLLTEFHKWASPVEMRQRSHAALLRVLDAEMEALANRVKNLEDRKS